MTGHSSDHSTRTHVFLWWLGDDEALSKNLRLIQAGDNDALLSSVNAFEITSKSRFGNYRAPRSSRKTCPHISSLRASREATRRPRFGCAPCRTCPNEAPHVTCAVVLIPDKSVLTVTDSRTATAPALFAVAAPLLNDARDVTFLFLTLKCACVAIMGVALFFVNLPLIWLAPLYWLLLFAVVMDRFTLMLHCTSHRQLFRKPYRALNHVIPWLLGPFFGQTPNTYFAHHLGMHHHEANLPADRSSTLGYRRDRFDHWLRYCFRFLIVGLFELAAYFYTRKQWRLFSRVVTGEFVYWCVIAILCFWNPTATLVVFLVPLVTIRTLMMMGNWTQHAFVCASDPENPYRSSITCINVRYNRRCFNDGYHTLHHLKPRCHWTEHPAELERAMPEYGRNDAIVFDGIDYFGVWWCLMWRRWSTLADRFVTLENAPPRTRGEIIEFLRSRTLPHARSTPRPSS